MLDDKFWDQFESGSKKDDDLNEYELNDSGVYYSGKYNEINLDDILHGGVRDTPEYKLNCWKDTILNHDLFKDSIVDLFLEMGSDLSKAELGEAGRAMAFNKAYEDIRDLDLDDPEVEKQILLASDYDFVKSLEIGIKYFEEEEEYEKCAFLHKIQKKGQNIPPKLGSRKEKR